MGFHPAWKYKEVHELTFEEGKLVKSQNFSKQMQKIRDQMKARKNEGKEPTQAEIEKWIESTFDQRY